MGLNWFIVLSLLPFLRPDWMPNYSPTLNYILLVWELLGTFFLIILYCKNRKKISLIVWAFAVLELWMLASAFIHGDYGRNAFIYVAFPTGFIVLLINYYIDEPKALVSSMMLGFEICIYAELFTILKYSGTGIMADSYYGYIIYFLGEDNALISYVFPSLALALLYMGQCEKKTGILRSVLLIAAVLFVTFRQFSATTVVGVCVVLLLLLLYLIPKCREILSFAVLYPLTLIAHYLIVEYRITENVPVVTDFITNVLHKSPSMSARTPLWDAYYALFDTPSKWLFGLGYCPIGNVTVFRDDGSPVTMYSHNIYYEMIAQGGIIQLLLLFVIIFLTGKTLVKSKGTYSSTVLTAVLIGICCAWLCEVPIYTVWIVFMLGYFADRLEPSMVEWKVKLPVRVTEGENSHHAEAM